jgi:hypothetical protein
MSDVKAYSEEELAETRKMAERYSGQFTDELRWLATVDVLKTELTAEKELTANLITGFDGAVSVGNIAMGRVRELESALAASRRELEEWKVRAKKVI